MALELYMVGVVAQDVDKSLEFYRRLGLAIPPGSDGQPHVAVKMAGDLTFFLNSGGRLGELPSSGMIFEFYLKERAAVDAKYSDLCAGNYSLRFVIAERHIAKA